MKFFLKNSCAFTLSEVLITIGIIGIVASLTIPNLIASYQKQETVSRLKKTYSTLTQAVKLSEAENGAIENWDFPTVFKDSAGALEFCKIYLIPYLKVTKICTDSDKSCWAKSLSSDGETNIAIEGGPEGSYWIKLVLDDGTVISILNYGLSFSPLDACKMSFIVDTNGLKKPNQMGKDVFAFFLAQKKSTSYNSGWGDFGIYVPAGGIFPDGYKKSDLTSNSYRGCSKSTSVKGMSGAYCSQKIIIDGWQIKDDYPW